ncbi:siderophore iron transporter [Purpureocillium lilacinum]|uniref:Siderophore iron transporter n=1 Tax=Purpureocillium lilacinum TaxID=33203 RepID=A0A179GJW1_PURLI|nr:siderophore iron transporter [Purpureocillium lilacinum]OAQ78164.1 siderophore iron transporter [Purpureocillium lilacinum]PWI73087.1 siderophore iron transporter [Purpureocillium lilacinum]
MSTTQATTEPDKDGQTAHHEDTVDDEKSQPASESNLVYSNAEEEPEIHLRTYIALAAMLMLNYVQIIALQGPPVVLENIGESLHNTAAQTWVPNALALVQAVLAPIISSASDTFQARKLIMVVCCVISFIGSAIAPGSQSIYRLIVAQILIGFGFSSTALAYCVPSEILPKKWRPMVQSIINIAAALGACSGPLIIGALSRYDPENGWRKYFWIQMALWGATAICIFVGYRPLKRHTVYDNFTLSQKLMALDIIGVGLFTAGLTLFLVGLNLGGGLYLWTNAKVLVTLVVGLVTLLAFIGYEWKGTKTGMAHHDLFRAGPNAGRVFGIFLGLIFVEGIMLFAFVIFYPVLTTALFEQDSLLLAARAQPFWLAGGASTVVWGYWSVKAKSIRVPLCAGFVIFTGGIIGFTTIQPGDSTRACIFAGLAGIGFGAPLILIIAGIQLATPHSLIATGTALAITSRAVSTAIFTAIFSAALTDRLEPNIISYVSRAAISAGLPASSVQAFVMALSGKDEAALMKVPGVTPPMIEAGITALKQAFADSIRVIFIIAAPFGTVACLLCFFLDDQSKEMNYRVDAPVEDLHVRSHRHHAASEA